MPAEFQTEISKGSATGESIWFGCVGCGDVDGMQWT